MHRIATLLFFLLPVFVAAQQPKLQLVPFATGFVRPTEIAHIGDSRLFVIEQRGLIWIVDSLGNKSSTPFLDIDARVRSTGNEQGLLGLAFHPDYATNGYFYVNYTRETDGDTRISRFTRSAANPNQADPDSEVILLTVDQPFSNHNGGATDFGPDGYLYSALGDGGSGGDPQNNGQKKNTLLGKIIRIDVDNPDAGLAYGIPDDNPFVADPAYRPEIWSLGLRNPWRFSFDRLTADMWIADVGQTDREEIDFEPAGTGGRNYGWRCFEGNLSYNPSSSCPPDSTLIFPVFEYDNSSLGCSVTGGYVYRGSQYSDLYGWYLFTDYCSGRFWGTRRVSDGTFATTQLADLQNNQFSTFGEDASGELYVAALSEGTIYRVRELCSSLQVSGTVTHATCDSTFDGIIDVSVTGGAAPITWNWTNTPQTDTTIVYLTPGIYVFTAQDANGCVRADTFEVLGIGIPPAPTISASGLVLCPGDSLTLTASGAPPGYGYAWFRDSVYIPSSDSVLLVPSAGAYQVQAVGLLCDSPLSPPVQITQVVLPPGDPLSVSINNDTIFVQLNLPLADAHYSWALDGQPLPNDTLAFLPFFASGTYTVQVTGEFVGLCTVSTTGTIYAIHTGTRWPGSITRFDLAPNPTDGLMTLRLELARRENFSVYLTDAQQRRLFYQTHQGQQLTMPIDLRALPAGTYLLTLEMNGTVLTQKVVRR